MGWISITLEIWTQYTWLFVCQYLFVLLLDCSNPGVCFLTQFQIQNCLKTLGWIILQYHQICHPMQGPSKLLSEGKKNQNNCFWKENAKVHHRDSEDHMKKALNLKFLPPNVKMLTMYSRSNALKYLWTTPQPHPLGPKIDFINLKSYGGTTWTPRIISITMGPLYACTLFWFPYIMAGYCFQYVNDVFSLQEYGLWSHLSEWVWFKYLYGGGRGGWSSEM